MGIDMEAKLATSCGTRRRVITSVDIPSADSWQMSLLVRMVIEASAAGVGGMVVLRAQLVGVRMLPLGSAVGRQKCFRIGQVTEVDV